MSDKYIRKSYRSSERKTISVQKEINFWSYIHVDNYAYYLDLDMHEDPGELLSILTEF